jgi:hypothetical protein
LYLLAPSNQQAILHKNLVYIFRISKKYPIVGVHLQCHGIWQHVLMGQVYVRLKKFLG